MMKKIAKLNTRIHVMSAAVSVAGQCQLLVFYQVTDTTDIETESLTGAPTGWSADQVTSQNFSLSRGTDAVQFDTSLPFTVMTVNFHFLVSPALVSEVDQDNIMKNACHMWQ